MNLEAIQNISLDFTIHQLKTVRCIEDDHQSRIINISITNNGVFYPLDKKTMKARYKMHKPDHTYVYNKATINDDGTVTITLSDQAMAFPGISHSALQISKNEIIISTMPFNIVVEKSVYSNKEMESQHESDVFRDMIIHVEDYGNPHKTTKEQVELGNVDNTSDMDKPVSTAQQAALDEKVDKNSVATSSALGLVKSGTDITVDENGNVSVNDNSHNHMASNISDLPEFTQDAISVHNTSSTAHNDIRELVSILTTRLNALADSDDTTLDQLSEIVAYIKSNRSLIENVTTNKVNISDIIDNLTSTNTNKPLSANQGKILNDLIAALTEIVDKKVDKTNIMAGATIDSAGTAGLVPAPGAGEPNRYLRSDGIWQAPTVNALDDTKLPLDGDTQNNVVTFTSEDSTTANKWTDVAVLASKEKHSSIFNKISTMFKNIRYLYKALGTTDISMIGDGTVTGAVSELNTGLGQTLKCKAVAQSIAGLEGGNNKNIVFESGISEEHQILAAIPYFNYNGYLNVTAYVIGNSSGTPNTARTFRINNHGNATTTSGFLFVIFLYV